MKCLFSTSYTYHNIEVLPNAVTLPSNCVKSSNSNWNFPHSQRDNWEVGRCCRVPLGHQRQPHSLLRRLCGAQPLHRLHRHCNLQGQGSAWHQASRITAQEKYSTSTKSTWEWEMRNVYNRRLALLKMEIAAQTFCKAESVFQFAPLNLQFSIYKMGKLFHQEVIKCWHSACPNSLWSLCPSRYSISDWTRSRTTCSNWMCSEQQVGLETTEDPCQPKLFYDPINIHLHWLGLWR